MRWVVPPVFCLPIAFAGETHLTPTLSPQPLRPKGRSRPGGEGDRFAAGGTA